MALATISSSLVAFTCAHPPHRVSLAETSRRLARRFLKLSKITNLAVENHGRNFSLVRRCSCGDSADAESSTFVNGSHDSRVADSEGSSLGYSPCSSEQFGHHTRRAAMLASVAFLGGVGGTCCCCCNDAAMAAAQDWSYGDPAGASKWGGTCAIGARQSPIDVRVSKAQHGEFLGELQFDYKLCTPTFKNPGHGTMQVNFPEGVNKLRLKGRELNLVQFHFHSPSEHAFDGVRFPMEAHLVHQDAVTKAYAVVGIMLDASPDAHSNGALAAALQYSPLEHGKTLTLPNVQVSANDLLPTRATKDDRHYIHYLGSFTTPPCTESVDWFLLEKPLRVSSSEVLEFVKFVGDEQTLALNARPIQPLGDREIFEGP